MIRKFRAIVQSRKAPTDHEVIWAWKGKLLYYNNGEWQPLHSLEAVEVEYETEEDIELETVNDALDKLTYKMPEIEYFTLAEEGTYERGTTVETQTFCWKYNKYDNLIIAQSINGHKLNANLRAIATTDAITEDTTYELKCSDGKNVASATASINFVDYVYYSTGTEVGEMTKTTEDNCSITAGPDEYVYVFIPASTGLSKIYCRDTDVTEDFTFEPATHTAVTGYEVEGILYKSINHSLGELTLKFK